MKGRTGRGKGLGARGLGVCVLCMWTVWLSACSLVTVPVETAVKVAGTVVTTAVKAVTAPIRWAADAMTREEEEEEEAKEGPGLKADDTEYGRRPHAAGDR